MASRALVRRSPAFLAVSRSLSCNDMILKKGSLVGVIGWKNCPDFSERSGHCHAATRSAFDESLHDQEGFVHFFERRGVFADGDS